MMFNRYLIIAVFLWLIVAIGSAWMVFFTFSHAEAKYSDLMAVSDQHKKKQSIKPDGETRQTRTHVSKQIILNRGTYRDQSRLASEKSELVLHNRGEGVELIEYFEDINCIQQEKLFLANQGGSSEEDGGKSEQLVRQLAAQEAIYSYRTGLLEAKDVEFTRFLCPGNAWPGGDDFQLPLMRGKASTIAIKLSEEPTFKAEGFHATFHDWWDE
jgi:hypothetical protein